MARSNGGLIGVVKCTTADTTAIQTITASGNYIRKNCTVTSVNALIIAGGGGSGFAADGCSPSGAGGAGGYRHATPIPISAKCTPVTVGGGGAGGTPGAPAIGTSGSNSVFGPITSNGGGGGGGVHTNPGSARQEGAAGGLV